MMRAMTAIKNAALSGNGPAEVLMKVNNLLCEGNDAEMFVTVWVGILNLRTGRIECANAGHEYPVVMRSETGYELLKDRHGLVLAAMPDIPMRSYEIQLNPGDRLFVYTDGVPEAINEKEKAYGTDRLVQRLNRQRKSSVSYSDGTKGTVWYETSSGGYSHLMVEYKGQVRGYYWSGPNDD